MIDVAWLAETGPCRRFKGGVRIPCPGSATDRAMYILLTGRVDVFRTSAAGGTQSAGSLLPGDVFGGREYFIEATDYIYTAGIDSVVFVLHEESFKDISWSRPDILFDVLKAAYMPLRRLTASQKTVKTEPDKAESIELKPAGRKAAEEKPAEMISLALADAGASIFPDGHKSYPGITKPEYMKLVFLKDYDCPFCKKLFSDYKIFRSKLYETSPMRFDLRRFYTDFQTEWYDVLICRNCFFSTLHTYFNEPKPLKKEVIDAALSSTRASIHIDFDAERDIDFVFTAHYLAMLCSDGYLSAGKQIRAKLWGNLSWLYEDVGDTKMARFAAGNAADAYEAIYAGTRLTPVQEQITCLSIAGMQYRAGVDRDLKKYLFTAKTIKMGDRTYAKLAEDFMYEV